METRNGTQAHSESSRTHTGSARGCCGGPAPAGTDACCAHDAAVKSKGGTGCGCGSAPRRDTPTKAACCTWHLEPVVELHSLEGCATRGVIKNV